MKIKGEKIHQVFKKTIVIPDPETGEPVMVFVAQACNFSEDLEKIIKEPQPPYFRKAGQTQAVKEVDNPQYLEEMKEYEEVRFAYMILRTLEATPDLEWETIDMADPTTYKNYRIELQEAGLTDSMINLLILKILGVHNISPERIDEATQRFLSGQAQAKFDN